MEAAQGQSRPGGPPRWCRLRPRTRARIDGAGWGRYCPCGAGRAGAWRGRAGGGGRMTATAGSRRRIKALPPFWEVDSTPFSAVGPVPQPCRIVLRQIDDNDFALVEPLVFTPAEGTGLPERPLVIQPHWLTSDLASIPSVVGWFARRHGRHTPAALVHDLLIRSEGEDPPDDLPAEWVLEPDQADLLFRELLVASGVPPVRSY